MQYYILKKHTDNSVIFAGHYETFTQCLEDAVERKVDLTYINLKNKNISNANLDGVYMPGALLCGSNLTGTNLSEATLNESIFYNCSLYNTCLSYSDLHGSDFRSANFGATLIDGSNIQDCIFSTLSCFDLDFYFTENMNGCLFSSPDGALHKMSQRPIVLKGFMNTHIIVLDNAVKIGVKIFPKTILPTLINIINAYIKTPALNDNHLFLNDLNVSKDRA